MDTSSQPKKTFNLPTLSILVPILILIVWCIYIVFFGVMTGNTSDSAENETMGYSMLFLGAPLAAVITVILSALGMVFGFVALRKQDPRRGLAIAGLIINFVCLLPYILFGILLLLSAIPSKS